MGARELAGAVRARRVSAQEVAEEALAAVSAGDGRILAFTAVDPELVRRGARGVDQGLARGDRGFPLAGVPIAVKDVVDVSGLPSSYGTPAIPDRRARADAECVARLKAAGCVVIGKTRTSELAWRGDTPPTVNPRDPLLTPGGSSGGSAAAVAAGFVPLAIGTDTGGSARWPAAQCGVVGLKPTTGLVSTVGVLPCSPSLDCVGLLGEAVSDVRLGLEAVVDGQDASPDVAGNTPAGSRLAVLEGDPFEFVDDHASELFRALVELLSQSGATVVWTRLPGAESATTIADVVSLAEGAFLGELAAGRRELLSVDVRTQLEAAALISSDALERARRSRVELAGEADALMTAKGLDAILLPATTAGAVRRASFDEVVRLPDGSSGTRAGWASRAYHLASATGQPAVVIPDPGTLGAGAQLVGKRGDDLRLLALAERLETVLSQDRS